MGEIRLINGERIHIDGGDDGALRIQGKNLRGAWCDEVGLWKDWERAWNESLAFAVRLPPSRIVVTGTPKGRAGIPKLLLDDPAVRVSQMRTSDNAENLSPEIVQLLEEKYGGTRLGRQELEGELLDDVEGALWSYAMIESARLQEAPDLQRIVVAIDPAVTATGDETGIVVAGIDDKGHGYILDDLTMSGSPNAWAAKAVAAYHAYRADRIVAERNNGGDMVSHTIHTVDDGVSVRLVWASKGKHTRAEPVAALYEQGRIHHVGAFADLEQQLTGWTPDHADSPDRLDALVWALTDLLLGHKKPDLSRLGSPSVPSVSNWK